jgi:hypothetical protein
MSEFFSTGRVADVVLLLMMVEAIGLAAWRQGRGFAVIEVVFALLPGVLLVLALRAALLQLHWTWVALFLALALPVHLADLRYRWLCARAGVPPAKKRLDAPAGPE